MTKQYLQLHNNPLYYYDPSTGNVFNKNKGTWVKRSLNGVSIAKLVWLTLEKQIPKNHIVVGEHPFLPENLLTRPKKKSKKIKKMCSYLCPNDERVYAESLNELSGFLLEDHSFVNRKLKESDERFRIENQIPKECNRAKDFILDKNKVVPYEKWFESYFETL